MSGPKVVRIVTREEIVAICRGHFARVDAAIAEWIKIGRRSDCVSDEDIAATEHRRDQLEALLASDRFMDLQKQAPEEIAFLREDMQARLMKIAFDQANARTHARRQSEAASALLSALERAGKSVSEELDRSLRALAAGKGDTDALAAGFALLSAPPAEQNHARYVLAQSLKDDAPGQNLAAWLAAQPKDATDAALDRLESRLAEHDALLGEIATADWRQRLRAASTQSGPRRSLVLDSLELDVGKALASARGFAIANADLRLLLAEAAEAGVNVTDLEARLPTASDLEQLAPLRAEAETLLAERRDNAAAHARRLAVLEGLASMGYEVREGMETTWVEQGRMVLRNASRPDYGVEIGNPQAPRVQMKPVAFDAGGIGPDPSRDRDAETLWCGDVAAMQARLARDGGELVIEKSLPVGATPLKRIAIEGGEDLSRARDGPQVRSRALG